MAAGSGRSGPLVYLLVGGVAVSVSGAGEVLPAAWDRRSV